MKSTETPTLEDSIATAIQTWFGEEPVVVAEALDALVGTIALLSVKAGCVTPERRLALADNLRTNVLSALEYYGPKVPPSSGLSG